MVRAELIAFRRGPFEAAFNLIGIFSWRQARTVRNAKYVRVDRNRWLTKGFVQYNICGLATDPWQAHQSVTCLRHLAAKLVEYHLTERDDILGFVAPQADRFDMLGDARLPQRYHRLRRIRDFEQLFGGFVDADISGLRRQSDGDDGRRAYMP